jgi:signal transduction histidine kinase
LSTRPVCGVFGLGAPALLPVTAGKDDEITRLGHTFNALLDRIRRANDRERQFLADASYELRSPLALMRTELEWALLKPRDNTETRTSLESLSAQVERLITLTNALLDLEEVRAADTTLREPVYVIGTILFAALPLIAVLAASARLNPDDDS